MIHVQKQTWDSMTLYVLIAEGGTVQLEIYSGSHADGVQAYICNLWVDKDYRRRGIARALLDKAEELARKERMKYVYLRWSLTDTPRWMLDHYFARGYESVSGHDTRMLLRLKLKKT